MIEALKRIWGSRKTWQLTAAGVSAGIAKLLALAAIYYGWTPDHMKAMVDDSSDLVAHVFAACGALAALLTALEDAARKWGVTEAIPHEVRAEITVNPKPAGE